MKSDERRTLEPHVRAVLEALPAGRNRRPYLTAYQVLALLPPVVRDELITVHGRGGLGAAKVETAASIVSQVLTNELDDVVEVTYLDARNVSFDIAGTDVLAGNPVVGLYRIRP